MSDRLQDAVDGSGEVALRGSLQADFDRVEAEADLADSTLEVNLHGDSRVSDWRSNQLASLRSISQ